MSGTISDQPDALCRKRTAGGWRDSGGAQLVLGTVLGPAPGRLRDSFTHAVEKYGARVNFRLNRKITLAPFFPFFAVAAERAE